MTSIEARHQRFAFDDGAYVLGALEPADRRAFETHLAECPRCQESVAELTGLPVVLDQVELAALEVPPPPATLLPRLLNEVRRQRSRRSWRTGAVGFVAACMLAVLAGGGVLWYHASHQPKVLVMQAVGSNPAGVHATVKFIGSGQQPRIQLDCGYHDASPAHYPAGTAPPTYKMLVYNRLGMQRDLGSWTPQPGEDVEIIRDSPWSRQALTKIEIATGSGVVLLSIDL